MTIYEKLMVIQQKLNAPKNQRNDFGKYNYRSCEDILQAVKPLLKETETVLMLTDDIVAVTENRIYVRATAKLIDAKAAGMSIEVEALAREEETKKGMDGSQITGAASSYARKYALNGLFAIDDNKDSDATNDQAAEKKVPKHNPVSVTPGPVENEDGYYICSCCGLPISGIKQADGTILSPKDVAVRTKVKFGEALCLSCSKERSYNG